MPLDSWTRRVISAIEPDSSPDALAALRTWSEAASEACADCEDSVAVERAVSVSWRATRSNSVDALSTWSRMLPTLVSKESTKWPSSALRWSAAAAAAAACSERSRWRSWELLLKTATVRAISPISSPRSSQSMATSLWPLAIAVSDAVTEVSGPVTAHDQQGQGDDEQRRNAAGNRHQLQGPRQHYLELGHRNAHIENADHLAGRTDHREIGGHERPAEQVGRPLIGLAAAQQRLARMVGGELGADGALAILLLDIGRAAHELPTRFVIDEQCRVAADIGYRPVDNRVILQLGHLRQLDTGDDALMKRDLGVLEALAEGQRQRAQIDLDVAQRPLVELLGQRPIGRPHDKRSVHRNQDNGGDHRLGAKPELELRDELPVRPGHEKSPSKEANLTNPAYNRLNGRAVCGSPSLRTTTRETKKAKRRDPKQEPPEAGPGGSCVNVPRGVAPLPIVRAGIDDLPQLRAVGDLLHLGGQPAIAPDPVLHRVGIVGHQVGGALEARDLDAEGEGLVVIGLVEAEAGARGDADPVHRHDAKYQRA